ncbi:CG0192-related protein [Rhodococcus sp. 24CO]|uniref:CG0192-related protein n=1 Tax=Rhodococcus sp. 24CO TaxID=3117460 RepID=UPI003D34B724
MALIHSAQLNPSKIDLLRAWVPGQPWVGSTDPSSLEHIDACRFDDPDGEVGIETHLLRTSGGAVLQVPLTYRGAPLAGAEAFLISTMDHSVLGERWVYDACCDPVYVRALATTIVTAGTEAALEFANPGDAREVTAHVLGSGSGEVPSIGAVNCSTVGSATTITSGTLELTVYRVVDVEAEFHGPALTGTWPGQADPVLLASLQIG